MKKLFSTILIIINIVLLIPSNSYGICNTVNFTKNISAIQVILSDGTIIHDIRLSDTSKAGIDVKRENYKNLNLIFMINTGMESAALAETKNTIRNCITLLHDQVYGGNNFVASYNADGTPKTSKINLDVIAFKTLDSEGTAGSGKSSWINSVARDASNEDSAEKKTMARLEKQITDGKDNRNLEQALKKAQKTFDNYDNTRLLQYIILITDKTENDDIITASNSILKDLTDNNMIGAYIVSVSGTVNSSLDKLMKGIYAVQYSSTSIGNIESLVRINAINAIKESLIKAASLVPLSDSPFVQIAPNVIYLISDSGLLHGATLKIEYVMKIEKTSIYGNGSITIKKMRDMMDNKLSFNEGESLITDPSITNGDMGWHMKKGEDDDGNEIQFLEINNSQKLKTLDSEEKRLERRLILTTVLSTENLEETFENSAMASLKYDLGDGEAPLSIELNAKAMDVEIIPPTGIKAEYIYIAITVLLAIVITYVTKMKMKK